MTKPFNQLGTEGNYHNVIRTIYDMPTANIIMNNKNKNQKAFPLRCEKFDDYIYFYTYTLTHLKKKMGQS